MANNADVVLIDTAGRLHNKVGLMNELKKIKDVMKKLMSTAPDEVMLVLDVLQDRTPLSRQSSLQPLLKLRVLQSLNLTVRQREA